MVNLMGVGMRVLVLGGDGFCGWPTSLYLSDRGHDITVIDNLSRRKIDVDLEVESLTPIRPISERIRAWREVSGQEIGFVNLHPAAPEWSARLPGLRVRAFVLSADTSFREVDLCLDTLHADLDAGLLKLTWRGVTPVRETDLAGIEPGQRATVFVMAQPRLPLRGTVDSLGWGVASSGSATFGGLPHVESTLNWVRIAARFPVRVLLDDPPEDLMRLGASAVIQIQK